MPLESLQRQLDRIDIQQRDLLVAVTKLTDKLDKLNGDVAGVVAEIGGAPPASIRGSRETIRWRVHNLEQLMSPVVFKAAMHEVLNERRAAAFTPIQKTITISGVVIGAVFTVLRFAGLGG